MRLLANVFPLRASGAGRGSNGGGGAEPKGAGAKDGTEDERVHPYHK
jgi:hypothetical protein